MKEAQQRISIQEILNRETKFKERNNFIFTRLCFILFVLFKKILLSVRYRGKYHSKLSVIFFCILNASKVRIIANEIKRKVKNSFSYYVTRTLIQIRSNTITFGNK